MLLEVCVDTIEGAHAAVAGGAGRIELCAALSEGGLTPSAGLMRAAAGLALPAYAMIRPRAGLFHFSTDEVKVMLEDIAAARAAGLAGVVLGAQAADGGLDLALLARLRAAAGPLGCTLNRVTDVVPDPLLAVDQAAALGFERVLSSGGAPLAAEGTALLKAMVARAGGRIGVMAGAGLTAENVAGLVAATGVDEVHASCSRLAGSRAVPDFDPPGGRRETGVDEVRAMVAAVAQPS